MQRPKTDLRFRHDGIARLLEFADNSINFEVWVWTETLLSRPQKLRSKVNFLIWDHFKRAGIQIPYPQRDIYIKEMPAKSGI